MTFHTIHKDNGQSMAEYILIVALIAIVAVIVLSLLGQQISQVFAEVVCALRYGATGCAAIH